MNLYRHILVWLLRATGAVSFVLAVVHILAAVGIYDTYQRGQLRLDFLFSMMAPLAPALAAGALVALALSEILALKIKRGSNA